MKASRPPENLEIFFGSGSIFISGSCLTSFFGERDFSRRFSRDLDRFRSRERFRSLDRLRSRLRSRFRSRERDRDLFRSFFRFRSRSRDLERDLDRRPILKYSSLGFFNRVNKKLGKIIKSFDHRHANAIISATYSGVTHGLLKKRQNRAVSIFQCPKKFY